MLHSAHNKVTQDTVHHQSHCHDLASQHVSYCLSVRNPDKAYTERRIFFLNGSIGFCLVTRQGLSGAPIQNTVVWRHGFVSPCHLDVILSTVVLFTKNCVWGMSNSHENQVECYDRLTRCSLDARCWYLVIVRNWFSTFKSRTNASFLRKLDGVEKPFVNRSLF